MVDMREINYIIVHATGASAYQTTKSLLDYWRNILKWRSPGYHKVIDVDGTVERLLSDEKPSNGVAGHNHDSINIAYKGGFGGKDTRTILQKEALIKELKGYRKVYPNAVIKGHRDFSPDLNKNGIIEPSEFIKACPCFNAIEEYANL